MGEVRLDIGSFGSVVALDDTMGLAISTDSVGTKVLVAQMVGRYDTVGIDCVAMNANDLLCVGAEPIALVDALGREVELPEPAQRIVIAGRANFMLNDAVYAFPGAAERVSALTKATQAAQAFVGLLDPDAETKTRFMADAAAEEIAAAQPDLVLLKSYMQESLGDPLEQLGIPIVYLDFETPDQYERDLATLGQAFGDPRRAESLRPFIPSSRCPFRPGTARQAHR